MQSSDRAWQFHDVACNGLRVRCEAASQLPAVVSTKAANSAIPQHYTRVGRTKRHRHRSMRVGRSISARVVATSTIAVVPPVGEIRVKA